MDFDELYKKILHHYEQAKKSLDKIEKTMLEHSALSDVVPGYNADFLEFESYQEDNFTVLFVDMRKSTRRAKKIGGKKTFLSMHAYIPAMLEIISYHQGKVIDIMGDGIMAFWGGKKSGLIKKNAVRKAGMCGLDMIKAMEKVVNPILKKDGIEWEIDIGVGIAYGNVIVTKIGIEQFYDVKAFGDCINTASKYSDRCNEVHITKQVKDNWPKSKNGKLKFRALTEKDGGGYLVN